MGVRFGEREREILREKRSCVVIWCLSVVHTPKSGSLGLSLGSISPSVKCLKEQCQPHKPVEVIHVVCSELCLAHSGRSVNLALISSVIVTAFHTYLPCSFPREIVCPQTRTHLPVNCSHSYLHLSFPLITTIQNLKNSRKLLA